MATTRTVRLASPARRLMARALDLVFITLLVTGIGVLFFVDHMASVNVARAVLTLRLPLLSLATVVIYLTYFVLIPFFTGGCTLFKYLLLLKTAETKKRSRFFWHLLAKETILFGWFLLFNVILLLVSLADVDPQQFIERTFSPTYQSVWNNILYRIATSVFALWLIIISVGTLVAGRSRSFIDHLSGTCVTNRKKSQPPEEYKETSGSTPADLSGLPGTIAIEELNAIIEKDKENELPQ